MNTNYNITYPSAADYYDINVFNNNFSNLADGIDSVKSGGLKREVVVAAYNSNNPYKSVADFTCTKANGYSVLTQAVSSCCEGGTIVLLDGDYILNNTLVVNKTVNIVGYGSKTRIIQDSSFTNYSLFKLTAPNVSIKGITFEDSLSASRTVHLITISTISANISCCNFYMNIELTGDEVAPVYTEGYICRLFMSGCYIAKHNDGKYSVNGGNTVLKGVIMGNYCEDIDDDSELTFDINVANTGSVARLKCGAQNTKFYVKGGAYNG